MSSKQRDWRFELLRIFSMLLIVATHYFASDNWAVHTDPARAGSWAASAHDSLIMTGQIGVTLFVLISAYFLSTRYLHNIHCNNRCTWAQTYFLNHT